MTRTKQPSALSEDQVVELTATVEKLTQEVRVLRDTIDELREDLRWAINNREEFRCQPRHVVHITSMPLDPLAKDFGKRVNRFTAKDLPNESAQPSPAAASLPLEQGELFQ
jgi:hypothetical protein